jgi:hypothetical protein
MIVVGMLMLGPLAWVGSAAASGWIRPADGAVQRGFELSVDRYAAGQHRGVDLAAPDAARVLSACGGRVTFAGRVPHGGGTVSVRCGPLVATYQQLGNVAVRRGQVVLPGERIGAVRRRSGSRSHVYVSARAAATGAYIDPLSLFGGGRDRDAPPVGAKPRPRQLGPAPSGRRDAPAPHAALPATLPVAAPAGAAAVRRPWPVWAGLALVALALPLGGGLAVARRRRRESTQIAPATSTSLRERWPSM